MRPMGQVNISDEALSLILRMYVLPRVNQALEAELSDKVAACCAASDLVGKLRLAGASAQVGEEEVVISVDLDGRTWVSALCIGRTITATLTGIRLDGSEAERVLVADKAKVQGLTLVSRGHLRDAIQRMEEPLRTGLLGLLDGPEMRLPLFVRSEPGD